MATRNSSKRTNVPTEWAPREPIAGRGTVLVGPADVGSESAVVEIVPPGVLHRTSAGDPPLDRAGWRIARWEADAGGEVLIDQGRPAQSTVVSLAEVVSFVAATCPQHLAWVAGLVERRLRLAIGRMQGRDHAGRVIPGAAGAFRDLRQLQAEADDAFAAAGDAAKPYMRDGHFTGLVRDGYIAFIHGRKVRRDSGRGPHEPAPRARHSTLRPFFKDDEEDRPRPRPVD